MEGSDLSISIKPGNEMNSHARSGPARIVVMDSGVSSKHDWGASICDGLTIKCDRDGICQTILGEYEDDIGHGTAVAHSILKISPDAQIVPIKILDGDTEASFDVLLAGLLYVCENIVCDLVHISAGILYIEDYKKLNDLLGRLLEKNILIVAAFDNDGYITYPAACPQAIGVDVVNFNEEKNVYYVVENSVIDVVVADVYHRLRWVSPPQIIIKGSSFSCCTVTGLLANYIQTQTERISREQAIDVLKSKKQAKCIQTRPRTQTTWEKGKKFVKNMHKAIVFPFNKEIHALAANEKDLLYEITGYFDIRQSGRVGKAVSDVLPHVPDNKKQIQNVHDIPWESDFDTVICGHCDEISHLAKHDYMADIIYKAQKHHKKVYSFDPIDSTEYIYENEKKSPFFYPQICVEDVPENRFNRLRERLTPVLGVFGTSSCQGKMTLQMELRKRFIKDGYRVTHISTEPNGYLLGCDSVYPIGYHSACDVHDVQAIQLVNEMIWDITEGDDRDLIIVGGQSGTINYDYNNLRHYNLMQHELICATNPDVVALCVNPHDEIEYIQRTMNYFYSFNGQRVRILILYPILLLANQLGYGIRHKKLSQKDCEQRKKELQEQLDVEVYCLGNVHEMNRAYDSILKIIS